MKKKGRIEFENYAAESETRNILSIKKETSIICHRSKDKCIVKSTIIKLHMRHFSRISYA